MSLDIIKYRQEEMRKLKEQNELRKNERAAAKCKELGLQPIKDAPEKHFDHPDTMENGTALMLYLLAMAIGSIFHARWLIWLFATITYSKFVNRHTKK